MACSYSLTEREKRERDHKKTILQIAKDHEKARELENVQRYQMPQHLGKGEKGMALYCVTSSFPSIDSLFPFSTLLFAPYSPLSV